LITLFRDIKDEYQRLMAVEEESRFLLDLWLEDLVKEMKKMFVLFPRNLKLRS
jgi:hypothetical protein